MKILSKQENQQVGGGDDLCQCLVVTPIHFKSKENGELLAVNMESLISAGDVDALTFLNDYSKIIKIHGAIVMLHDTKKDCGGYCCKSVHTVPPSAVMYKFGDNDAGYCS